MRKLLISITLALLCLSTAWSQSATDRTAVEALVTTFGEAFDAHDVKAFAATFAEDADFTNWLGQSVHGRTQIEKFHVPVLTIMYKNGTQKLAGKTVRFIRPDVATVDVRSEVKGVVTPDGKELPLLKFLLNLIVTKEENGQWLIKIMHNTRLPE